MPKFGFSLKNSCRLYSDMLKIIVNDHDKYGENKLRAFVREEVVDVLKNGVFSLVENIVGRTFVTSGAGVYYSHVFLKKLWFLAVSFLFQCFKIKYFYFIARLRKRNNLSIFFFVQI